MSGYIYGYARVSTRSQELSRQLDLLNEHNCNEILTEKMTGTKANRPQLNRLKDKLRPDDTVIVESFSRLGPRLVTIKYMRLLKICRHN